MSTNRTEQARIKKDAGKLDRMMRTVNDAMTLEDYKRARERGDGIHFVRFESNTREF